MAINKPTTTDDIVPVTDGPPGVETPDLNVAEPEASAPKDETKYVRLTSPFGGDTTVPESIADALRESGYTDAKGRK